MRFNVLSMERFHGKLQKYNISGRNSVGEIARKWYDQPHTLSMRDTQYAGKSYALNDGECAEIANIVGNDGTSLQALGSTREGLMISYISLMTTAQKSTLGFFGVSGNACILLCACCCDPFYRSRHLM